MLVSSISAWNINAGCLDEDSNPLPDQEGEWCPEHPSDRQMTIMFMAVCRDTTACCTTCGDVFPNNW
jgi:hypothetical protein